MTHKKIVATLLAAIMTLTVFVTSPQTTVNAQTYSNIGKNNYWKFGYWAHTVTSYLEETEDGYMIVDAMSIKDKILIKNYNTNYKLTSEKKITLELPVFGAFYSDGKNYYILSGQNNPDEKDSVEVFRVTKYDKNWNRISAASLYGEKTTKPFFGGSAKMVHCGNYLIVKTCHEMYRSRDGKNHQAGVVFEINTNDMTVTDKFTDVTSLSIGYVSHTMNQFLKVDEDNRLASVDHGDAYPRTICLIRYDTNVDDGTFSDGIPQTYVSENFSYSTEEHPDWIVVDLDDEEFVKSIEETTFESVEHTSYGNGSFITETVISPTTNISMAPISGQIGDNYTGITVGDFDCSDSSYIVIGTTVDQDNLYDSDMATIFVSSVEKDFTIKSTPTLTTLLNPEGCPYSPSNPFLVKIDNNNFMMIWSLGEYVCYIMLDGKGEATTMVNYFKGSLSDCKPIVSRRSVQWYTRDNGTFKLYRINTDNINLRTVLTIQ